MRQIIIIFFILSISYCQSQKLIPPSKVKWYSFEKAMNETLKFKKPVFVDVYTDWCGWCKKMMGEAFADPVIAWYINEFYYPSKFDAESKKEITIYNQTFRDTTIGRTSIHQLAIRLLNGKASYPTMVYITPEGTQFSYPGYQKSYGLLPRLVYYGENVHKSKLSFEQFKTLFNASYPLVIKPNENQFVKSGIQWTDIDKALMDTTNSKHTFLYLFRKDSYTHKIFSENTLENENVKQYLSTNFTCSKFDAKSKATLNIGQTFTNKSGTYHSLAIALQEGMMLYPAILFFTPQGKLIFREFQYMDASEFMQTLAFIHEKKYTTIAWKDFKSKK